jgi:predicted negative regulator of RcsB-dependent stress response
MYTKNNHTVSFNGEAFVMACFLALVLIGFFSWVSNHDKQVAESAKAYEDCMVSVYHMTPAEYQSEFGSLPNCSSSQNEGDR